MKKEGQTLQHTFRTFKMLSQSQLVIENGIRNFQKNSEDPSQAFINFLKYG